MAWDNFRSTSEYFGGTTHYSNRNQLLECTMAGNNIFGIYMYWCRIIFGVHTILYRLHGHTIVIGVKLVVFCVNIDGQGARGGEDLRLFC